MNARVRTALLPWSLALALALLIAFLQAREASAPAISALADGRTGRIAFASANALPGGLTDGRPIIPSTVAGQLTLPTSCAPPFPAVVLLHGSLGVSQLQAHYRDLLLDACYATLAVDSFSGRGVISTVENQLTVTTESMVIDAYAALNLLQSHPKIDGKRIAVIGWSKGGTAAEHAMSNAVAMKFAKDGARFAAYVAFYPWCGEQIYADRQMHAPILFLLANGDDWVSASACAGFAERLRAADIDVRVKSFDVLHGFDNPELSSLYLSDAVAASCNYEPRADGFRDIETGVVKPWIDFASYFAACSSIGAHMGSDIRAADDAKTAMLDFLNSSLGNPQ